MCTCTVHFHIMRMHEVNAKLITMDQVGWHWDWWNLEVAKISLTNAAIKQQLIVSWVIQPNYTYIYNIHPMPYGDIMYCVLYIKAHISYNTVLCIIRTYW